MGIGEIKIMSSFIDYRMCPQCGGVAFNEFCSSGEEFEYSFRCGRWSEYRFPDEGEKEYDSGFVDESGAGLGRCMIMSTSSVGKSFSLSEPYSDDIEKWYMETTAKEDVDSENSYQTRWDEETGQAVVVHGKGPGLYDDFKRKETKNACQRKIPTHQRGRLVEQIRDDAVPQRDRSVIHSHDAGIIGEIYPRTD